MAKNKSAKKNNNNKKAGVLPPSSAALNAQLKHKLSQQQQQQLQVKVKAASTTDLDLDRVDPDVTMLPADAGEEQQEADGELPGGILQDELDVTVDTLSRLARDASVMKGREFKGLKTAMFNLHAAHALATGLSASLPSRISSALNEARWLDARIALAEMRLRAQRPRLGALQRWVRECDAAAPDSMEEAVEVWSVLEAILRCTTDEEDLSRGSGTRSAVQKGPKPVVWMQEWGVGQRGPEDLWEELQNGKLLPSSELPALKAPWKVLERIPGESRRPANAYPCILYHTPSSPLTLPALPQAATAHEHPYVPRLKLLTGVLTKEEAHVLVRSAEAVGLEPDEPLERPSASTLAHNLVWIIPQTFHDAFFDRLKHLLPTEVDGAPLVGINRRWRIYRYRPGALYRPHIDGGWPASSIDAPDSEAPTYAYDASVARASASDATSLPKPAMSRYTLLLYLNDGFDGGHTTFFIPSPEAESGVHAYPVRPIVGGAALFPHGAARGSLLHEGSGVTRGAKYVVRTEVLYEVDAATQA